MTSATALAADDLVREDLDRLLADDEALWTALRGARVLLTGGTGFVGKWLLEAFTHANERLALGMRITVVSRDPAAFARAHARLSRAKGVEWTTGDVRTFEGPRGEFSHAIHAATDVAAANTPLETFDVIRRGTERVVRFCRERHVARLLLVSSGAVYGRQPPELAQVDEAFPGAPSTLVPGTAYGQGKRAAEWEASAACAEGDTALCIARCFAFAGPYLPLDRHFAIGNFIGDAVAGRAIQVAGDGTAVRSYLYASDLARWLWTLLERGARGEAYNVGSEEPVAIADLARRVASAAPVPLAVRIAQAAPADRPAERYVPSTRKARETLGLHATVGLDEAISRTLAWARAHHG